MIQPDTPTTYGRTYAFASITGNTFIYNYQNTDVIHIGDGTLAGPTTQYSQLWNGSGAVEPDPNAIFFVDPHDMSVTTSGNSIQWVGVSPPATDVEINATEVNGVLYDTEAYVKTTNPPLISSGNTVQVEPELRILHAVGITTPGSTVKGGADRLAERVSPPSALGGSTLSWNGQTFNLGPANANDIVSATGQTVPITQGSYTALDLLAMSTGYSESMAGVFEIDYTNGSYDRYTIGVSDWKTGYTGTGGSLAPGESIVASPSTYDNWNGTQNVSTPGTVYGSMASIIPVDLSRTLEDLAIVNKSANMKIPGTQRC